MSLSDRERELLMAVAEALRSREDVPGAWVVAAKEAWTWRTVDAELAELAFDSLSHAAGTRSPAGTEAAATLVFQAPDVVVAVEVETHRLRVMLTPDVGAAVVVESADGTVLAAAPRGHGAFAADGVQEGPVRLRVHHDGRTVLTSWFRVP